MKIDMSINLTGEEATKAEDYMFNYLAKESGWFNTREEAEDWAGEVLFDSILTYLEALGIDISFDSQRKGALVALQSDNPAKILLDKLK